MAIRLFSHLSLSVFTSHDDIQAASLQKSSGRGAKTVVAC